MPSATPDYSLSEEQKQHFLDYGFVKLDNCFSLDDPLCKKLMGDMWERLGMDPDDKSTWNPDRVHLPRRIQSAIPLRDFSPKAWSAICELCGGVDRVLTEPKIMPPPMDEPVPQAVMNDSFIIALGNTALQNKWIDAAKQDQPTASNALTPAQEKLLDPHDRNNWHVDGDFFYHFLDSPEQGLLPIVLFSDVNVGGGATMICPPAISVLAKHLYAHPEGVRPDMSLRNGEEHEQRGPKKFSHSFYDEVVSKIPKDEFVCATGKVGDVYLLHPFMVHSGTPNYLHEPRIITNPPVGLREPFNFDRQDGSAYSLVEQKTMLAIGQPDGLIGWKATGERTLIVPERITNQLKAKKEGIEVVRKHWAPNVL